MDTIPPYNNPNVGEEREYDSSVEAQKGSSASSDTSGVQSELNLDFTTERWTTEYIVFWKEYILDEERGYNMGGCEDK